MNSISILIVEDNSIVVMELQDRLEALGYSVPATASSGENAIKKAAQHKPDLILMDIRLKGELDGIETAKQIQSKHDIPIIYLTAHNDEDTLNKANETNSFGYIMKPFEESELKKTIEAAVIKHKARMN